MDAGSQAIRDVLIDCAKSRTVKYNSEIASLAGLDVRSEVGRIRLAQILDAISSAEVSGGRPLLSAVAVSAEQNMPGEGFFSLAERLGLYRGEDRHEYWLTELERVYHSWNSPAH